MDLQRLALESSLLHGITIYQGCVGDVSTTAARAVELAGAMAGQLGARVEVDDAFADEPVFGSRGKARAVGDLQDWADGDGLRVALVACANVSTLPEFERCGVVALDAGVRHNEATLFARSGMADLLGDPDRAPLIPRGEFGAGTVAYGLLAALSALVAGARRFGNWDRAIVDPVGVLSWVNWKAAASGAMGRDLAREGEAAEWPIVPCADGYLAWVTQPRDWPQIVAMVNDPRLLDDRFATARDRARARGDYMEIIKAWSADRSKRSIMAGFVEYGIPAAAVMDVDDLLGDPLLNHREALLAAEGVGGVACRTPRLAHRIAALNEGEFPLESARDPGESGLPLAGIRVLDLGIITAGAGVSALLADLGAEVIKVESHSYPDPFRQWAGDAVSPLFKCNNRNKLGIALDLKDAGDRARFLDLVGEADVLVENFRRGVLERLDLGYDVLARHNPRIMLASISGQGLSGPGCGASSFGSTLEAASGFATHVSYAEETEPPYITGRNVNYPDQTVVLYAAAVIAAALSQPRRGMHLDISQRDVAVYLSGSAIEVRSSGRAQPQAHNGRAYLSRDGEWIAFDDSTGVPEGGSWRDWLAARSTKTALAELSDFGIDAALVLSGSQMYADRAAHTPYLFPRGPDGALVKGFPFQFRDRPMRIRLNSPEVGEHTAEVLQAKN